MFLQGLIVPLDLFSSLELRNAFLDELERVSGGAITRDDPTRPIAQLATLQAVLGEASQRRAEIVSADASLSSAVTPQRILDHLLWTYGYVPEGARASRYRLTLTVTREREISASILLPRGTLVGTVTTNEGRVLLSTIEDHTKLSGASTVSIEVYSGQAKDLRHLHSGQPNEVIDLNELGIDTTSLSVVVDGVEWSKVNVMAGQDAFSRVFRIIAKEFVPGERIYAIEFGDGTHGRLPRVGAVVDINYRFGCSELDNISPIAITRMGSQIVDGAGSAVAFAISGQVFLARARSEEHVDVARLKGPAHLSTHESVVTLEDYRVAALASGAIRATVFSGRQLGVNPNLISIVVATTFEEPPSEDELSTIHAQILEDYAVSGTVRMAVNPCEIEAQSIAFTFRLLAGYAQEDVSAQVEATVEEFFGPNAVVGTGFAVEIGKPIYVSPLVCLLQELEGIASVEVSEQILTPASDRALLSVSSTFTYTAWSQT